jgi:DNA (cytosine-5)-methyltransferase 1
LDTTKKEKDICLALLRNRRKSKYGKLDGNPLSLLHFQELISDISQSEIDVLVEKEILKPEQYLFKITNRNYKNCSDEENLILSEHISEHFLIIDELKSNKKLKQNKTNLLKIIGDLIDKEIIECVEVRYDFKNTKISTGLFGVNRVFLPTSDIFPTLVASDTNDFITTEIVEAKNKAEFREKFISEVYKKKKYRKISKEEACIIQGFPKDFVLPENRARWMKLVGNSVSVPVIEVLIKSIIETGVFEDQKERVLV